MDSVGKNGKDKRKDFDVIKVGGRWFKLKNKQNEANY